MLELLVSLLIVTLLLAGLYSVLFQTQTSFEAQQIAMTLRQEARIVVDGVAIELRMTGFDVGNLPEAITDARTSRLVFVADIDGGSAEPPCDVAVETAAGRVKIIAGTGSNGGGGICAARHLANRGVSSASMRLCTASSRSPNRASIAAGSPDEVDSGDPHGAAEGRRGGGRQAGRGRHQPVR